MIYIYTSEITDADISLPSFINEDRITNRKALTEKRSAYSLLYKAAKEVFGIDVDISKLTKTENDKPVYPDFYFSISHSKEICAVAISKENVGIDIEHEITGERAERIRKKILHKNELPNTDITELWTKKEAAFKLKGDKIFIGSQIDTTKFYTESYRISHNNSQYTVSIATYTKTEIICK